MSIKQVILGLAGDYKPSGINRRHRPDYLIALSMCLLMLMGLIIMYAIGSQRANFLNNAYGTDFYTSTYFFVKQSVSLVLALVAFVFFAKIPHQIVKKYVGFLLLAGLIVSMVLAISGWLGLPIAKCTLGACRWFNLGPLGSFQPAELLKFGVLVFGAAFLGSRISRGETNSFDKTILPFGVVAAAAAFIIVVIQNDMGTGLSLAVIIGALLWTAGINMRIVSALVGVAVIALVLSIVSAPHRMERFSTFIKGDDESSAYDSGYHIRNAKIAIGTGGLFGVGIGNSVQATGYLPETINDSVFAIMGETFGFVGLMVVLGLFASILLRLLSVANRLSDPWMRLVVAGVFGWLSAHIVLNIAAITGVAPLTGITLPLLSFGGTSMIFIASALGLAFQMSSYTAYDNVEMKENHNENHSSGRGVRRTRYSSRRSSARA